MGDLPGVGIERDHGRKLVQRLPDRPDAEEADGPQQAAEQDPNGLERQGAPGNVGEQGEERSPALGVVRVPAGEGGSAYAAMGGLGVEDDGRGHNHGAETGLGGPPTQVKVVAEDGELGVEPAQLEEHRPSDEHARRVDGEHLADLIVLALVVLSALQTGLAAPGPGHRHADL